MALFFEYKESQLTQWMGPGGKQTGYLGLINYATGVLLSGYRPRVVERLPGAGILTSLAMASGRAN
jgi:hypothetical protein